MRRFGFERLQGYDINAWQTLRQQALDAQQTARAHAEPLPIYGSDISGDMLIKARLNFERAGLPPLSLKQVDARVMVPPSAEAGIIVTNPPYGERLDVRGRGPGRRDDDGVDEGDHEYGDAGFRRARPDSVDAEFFQAFGNALKQRFAGWTVHVLTADMSLPGQMRLREARRTPLFNGAIECRLFRFDMIAGAVRKRPASGSSDPVSENA